MTAPLEPLTVADFGLAGLAPGALPSPRALVAAALDRGARLVAVELPGEDVGPLARTWSEAHRRGLGLVVRAGDSRAFADLRGAVHVEAGTSPETLRGRLLVVVASERLGKRLRREAPELPSALELVGTKAGVRGLLRFASPNLRRAAADADDLVVPWGRLPEARIVGSLVPQLARRGARLWLSDVPESDVAAASRLPVSGLLVRFAWA